MSVTDVEVCIVGLGPAGLGAALRLAQSPLGKNTVCLEAGPSIHERFCRVAGGAECASEEPCNMISGVGGSSALAGGKLSLYPAGRRMSCILGDEAQVRERLGSALQQLRHYMPIAQPTFCPEMLQEAQAGYSQRGLSFRYYDACRYNQADLARAYARMEDEISEAGVTIHTGARVVAVDRVGTGFRVLGQRGDEPFGLTARKLVMGVGRLGEGLLSLLNSSLGLEGQSEYTDVGVRLEFPTGIWPDIDVCHNDLKLQFGNARTFCVCKDGYLAPYRLGGVYLLEGRSDLDTCTGLTNLGLSIRLAQERDGIASGTVLAEIENRLGTLGDGRPIRQRLQDYLDGQRAYSVEDARNESASIAFWQWGEVSDCFPSPVADQLRGAVMYLVSRVFRVEDYSHISVFAPELDHYWLSFPLTTDFEARLEGLYLVGDCSGHFRGTLQALCSGLECGERISLGAAYVH